RFFLPGRDAASAGRRQAGFPGGGRRALAAGGGGAGVRTVVNGALLDRLSTFRARPTLAQALDAIEWLGGMARWWIRPEILRTAAQRCEALQHFHENPPLPTSLGSCSIALVMKRPIPVLRDALLLPLCWRSRAEHAGALPPALRRLATRVGSQLS